MAGNEAFPVEWTGQQAVVTLPEHIDVATAGQVRELLLSVINRGAAVLIADMTATQSCDHAGMDAMARAYQREAVSGPSCGWSSARRWYGGPKPLRAWTG